jgi:CrcB protein
MPGSTLHDDEPRPPDRAHADPAIDLRLHPGVLGCILVGGALGALARYGIGRVVHVPTDGFPRATFAINLSGAFALGCFLAFVHERHWTARYARPLFGLGFCGAFTTFSTMAVETVTLIKDGHGGLGVGYLLLSVAFGLSTCALGVRVGRVAAGWRPIGQT